MYETVTAAKRKADQAWTRNATWDQPMRDVFDFAIPFREPGGSGRSQRPSDRLFDMTGPTSAMYLAGQLQQMLFAEAPALQPGALVKQAAAANGPAGARELAKLERELERTGEFIYPFMQAGDLDTATHEMCLDLGVGTGAIIPLRGTPDRPIRFYTIPIDRVAILSDMFGSPFYISWKEEQTLDAVREAYPNGTFSDEFMKLVKSPQSAGNTCVIYQDFWKEPNGTWRFAAYLDRHCDEFITTQRFRTKPLATPRYYKVAGQDKGRGPIMLAMPTIKTVNKAQELALRAAAVNLLGIWGYRSGSGFNPDTASQAPGAFWSMQSTGGILGPDVQRLDPASANYNIASMVIEGSQQQIRDAMMDTRLAQESGTPRSASEIAARLRQNQGTHLGAFMRLWREVHPDIVPRCAEILASFGYLGGLMDFNELLVSVAVRSPMASALSAPKLQNLANYVDTMNAIVGPQHLPEHLEIDDAADDVANWLQVQKRHVPTPERRAQIRDDMAKQQQAMMMAQLAEKATPQVAAGAMKQMEGEPG